MPKNITQSEVDSRLNYNPETGEFTWSSRGSRSRTTAGSRAGAVGKLGYHLICLGNYKHLAHRLAWLVTHGEMPAGDVDHINGIKTDNRICNLRAIPRSENIQNIRVCRTNSKTGILGVVACGKKFTAAIGFGGRHKHLGSFTTADEAHQAYLKAKRIHHPGCTI